MTCDLLRPSRRDGETPGEAFPYSQGRQTAVVTASLPGNRPAGRADTAVPGPTSRDLLVIEHGSDRIGSASVAAGASAVQFAIRNTRRARRRNYRRPGR